MGCLAILPLGGEYLATRVQESLVHTSQGSFGLRMCTAVTQPVAPSCYYPTPQPRDDQYLTAQGGPMSGRHQYFTGYAVPTPVASTQPNNPGGEGGKIAQVQPQYHEPLSGEPHPLGDHTYVPVPHEYEPPARDLPPHASHARTAAASCSPPEYARISAASHHPHEHVRLSAARPHPHASYARTPAASCSPHGYARLSATSHQPPEYARSSAVSRGVPEFLQTPVATYGSPGDVQQPAMQYNPQDYTALPASSSHPTVRYRPRYKDLRYDGKSNWKAFLHKFVRLSRSQQWNETEQHDQFCFFLEGPASEYYTLMLETTPRLRFSEILRKFDKRFGSSAPDLTHQLNFQSATQNSGESLRQWSDRVLTLATRAFPQLPDVHTQAIPRLCYGAEDREAGLYALDGQPKTVEEAVDRMQYFQHSRQSRPPKPKREAVRAMADKDKVAEDSQKDGEGENEIKELKSRLQQLENALRESSIAQADPMSPSPPPPPQGGPVAPRASQCFKCGETGHFQCREKD